MMPNLVDFLLILLLLAAPLAFGTVHFTFIIIFAILCVIIFNLEFASKNSSFQKISAWLPTIIISSFFVGLALFQLIPWPKETLKFLSPATYNLYQDYSLNYNSWRSLSIYPWGTVSELIKIISYGLIFLTVLSRISKKDEKQSDSAHYLHTPFLGYLQLGCLTAILAILFHSLVDFNLHITANAFYFVVILGLAVGMIKSEREGFNYQFVHRITKAIIFIGFFIAVYSVIQRFGSRDVIYWFYKPDGSPFGPYANYDHYAGFMEMCTCLAVSSFIGHIRISSFFKIKGIAKKILWFSSREANKTLLYFLFSAVMAGSIFLSTSRGGILSFSMAVILFFFMAIIKAKPQTRKRIIFFIALILILSTIVVIWFGPVEWMARFEQLNKIVRFFIHEPPVLSELRPHIWQDTVKIVQDFPVWGTGLGTFSHIFSHYRDFAIELGFLRYTHCDYLQLVSEMGIMGGIFLVLFIFYFIKLYVRVVRRLQ